VHSLPHFGAARLRLAYNSLEHITIPNMRLLILSGFFLGLGVLVAYAISVGYRMVRSDYSDDPPMTELARHPEWTEVEGLGEVSFRSADGSRIAGWCVPSRNRAAVVLLHGSNADRASLLPELRTLAAAGFGVLAYDSPGYGASEGKITWGSAENQALGAALDWLSARPDVDPQRIGAVGFSIGTLVVVRTAATDARIKAIVLLGAPIDTVAEQQAVRRTLRWGALSEFGIWLGLRHYQGGGELMPPEEAIARVAPRPILIVGGTSDSVVPIDVTQASFRLAREPKTLWIVPGAAHGNYSVVAPDEYRRRLTDFFSRALLK
jgi:uncharacterized protein